MTQTRTARQFEAIGERVAESLLAVFEAEGVHIPENGQTAVALALAPLAVEPRDEHAFITQFLAQWGSAQTTKRVRHRTKKTA